MRATGMYTIIDCKKLYSTDQLPQSWVEYVQVPVIILHEKSRF